MAAATLIQAHAAASKAVAVQLFWLTSVDWQPAQPPEHGVNGP